MISEVSGLQESLLLEMVVIELSISPKSSPNLSPQSNPESRVQILHLPPSRVLEARPLCENFPQLLHQIILSGIKPPQHELILSYIPSRSDRGTVNLLCIILYWWRYYNICVMHTDSPMQ